MPKPVVRLGRYRLVERIAQGGMGEIFRAVDTGFAGAERVVAIKRISPDLGDEPEFEHTFANEAKLSFLLNHVNVARVLDVGHEAGALYIVLEWVNGADVGTIVSTLRRTQLGNQAMPVRMALTIVAEVARGLDYTHRLCGPDGAPLGLVHRDVSPSNILVSVEGEVKITDFGIARSRLRQSASLPGQLKGKLFYMAPEQARAEAVDGRADVFGLGAVLYELLSGSNPFMIDGMTAGADLLERVRQGQYPRLVEVAPSVPADLAAIVTRAMAPAKEDRYASCRELRKALADYALRHGYVLSVDELGELVRTLLGAGLAPIPTVDSDGDTEGIVTEASDLVTTAPQRRPPKPALALVPPPVAADPLLPPPTKTTNRGPRLALLTLIVISILGALGAKWLRYGATPTPVPAATGNWVVPDLGAP